MVYLTGDIHGKADRVVEFCEKHRLTEEDILIILGDVGANFHLNTNDARLKQTLSDLAPTIFCVHGNHEERPYLVDGYKSKEWHGGKVWYQDEYPYLLFADDGSVFDFDGVKCLVIGGAYSVDKERRLTFGWPWFESEQPTDEVKQRVENVIKTTHIDCVLSHTCPFKYEPVEAFLPVVDQSAVDNSTEKWLDTIEEQLPYKAWYCGHWHIDKKIDKMHFLLLSYEELEGSHGMD